MDKRVKLYGVNAVIMDQHQRVLLTLRQDMPFWNLPGGMIDPDEDPEQALHREIAEELDGLPYKLRHHVGSYITERGGEDLRSECYLLDTIVHENLRIKQPEDEEIKWAFFNSDQLPGNIFPLHRPRLMDALIGNRNQVKKMGTASWEDEAKQIPISSYVDLDFWLAHPAILRNKEKGIMRYWPFAEENA